MSFTVTDKTVENIATNSIILEIETRRYGIKVVGDMGLVEIKAVDENQEENETGAEMVFRAAKVDKSLFTIRKKLFHSQEWKDIKNFDQETYRHIQKRALKSNLRSGCYRLPNVYFAEMEAYLAQRMEARKLLVEDFVAAYESLRDNAQDLLGPTFNIADYDTPEVVRSRFSFDYQIKEETVPVTLKALSSNAYKRELEKQKSRVSGEVEAMVMEIRKGFAALIKSALEQMTPDDDGKEKQLRQVTIDNLNSFLNTFDGKNLAGDKSMGALVKECRSVIKGVTAKGIKEQPEAQATIQGAFEKFNGKLDTMLKTNAGRKVRQLED